MAKKQAPKQQEVPEVAEEQAVDGPAPEMAEAPREVMAKGSSTPAVSDDLAAWGNAQISSQDIIIPRILLMQPMSEKVTGGTAKFGEFRESLNNELLGDFEKGFSVVPFHMEKVFVEFNCEDPENKEFLRVNPITPQNENLPYEDEEFNEEAGKKIKISRDRTMNFYVLLPAELEVGGAIPYILSMRRTSLQAGKKLATQMFVKNMAAGKNPAAVTVQISAGKQTEDKKTWAVMDVKPVGPTDVKHVAEAFKWLQLIKSGKAKAHEESYNEDAGAPTQDVPAASGPARF